MNINSTSDLIKSRRVVVDGKMSDEWFFPWHRYFARTFDITIYINIIYIIFNGIFLVNTNTKGYNLILQILAILLLLVVEPILISTFKTTLGKWILGIRVVDNNGDKLSLGKSYERTLKAMINGMALWVPFVILYCNYKSYKKYQEADTLEWENESKIYLVDNNKRRIFYYIGSMILTLVIVEYLVLLGIMPYRGNISVDEFETNFNRYYEYLDLSEIDNMYSNYGQITVYVDGEEIEKEIQHSIFLDPDELPFEYYEDDAVMTGLVFDVDYNGEEVYNKSSYRWQKLIAFESFVGVQKDINKNSKEYEEIAKNIIYLDDYKYTIGKFTIYQKVNFIDESISPYDKDNYDGFEFKIFIND